MASPLLNAVIKARAKEKPRANPANDPDQLVRRVAPRVVANKGLPVQVVSVASSMVPSTFRTRPELSRVESLPRVNLTVHRAKLITMVTVHMGPTVENGIFPIASSSRTDHARRE